VDIAQASVRLLKPIDALTAHAPPAPKQWRSQERRSDLILQAIKVKELFKPGVQYLVDDDKIVLIDEFTGRAMSGRRLSEGLHQALEAKEGVTVQRENITVASITFQNLFRSYDVLAGMTGTIDRFLQQGEWPGAHGWNRDPGATVSPADLPRFHDTVRTMLSAVVH